jgi:hypothetical protein
MNLLRPGTLEARQGDGMCVLFSVVDRLKTGLELIVIVVTKEEIIQARTMSPPPQPNPVTRIDVIS